MVTVSAKSSPTSIFQPLDALRDTVASDAAIFLEFRQHDEEIVVTNVTIAGEIQNWWLMKDGIGPRGFDSDACDEALGLREGQWCLQAPATRHFNRFCWLEEDIAQISPWERTPAFESLYAPNRIDEQYRAILVDHGQIVGWVAFFWKTRPRQRDLTETRVSARLEELRDIVIAHHAIPPKTHRMLVDDTNEMVALDADAASAFGHDALRAMRMQCKQLKNDDRETFFFEGYGVTVIPMTGEGGRASLLLINPLEAVSVDMRIALTTLQKRVAELVAEGNSNRAVADILGVSVNTVKYHLKRIYPILGVANRVELATFLSAS